MRAYLISRLGQTALVVFLSLTAVFLLMRLGGDPVLLYLPMDIQAKDVNEFRQRLGFNDPLVVQYGRFVSNAARGDFGESLRYRRDALGLVLERLPATLSLATWALLLAFSLAIPIGVISATKRGSIAAGCRRAASAGRCTTSCPVWCWRPSTPRAWHGSRAPRCSTR